MATQRICSIPDCGKPACNKRGWCSAHYHRVCRYGDPLGGGKFLGEVTKYFQDVVLTYTGNDCLLWPYGRSQEGYARVTHKGRYSVASRIVCEHLNGPAPTRRHEAAHTCGNGNLGCVTGRHLVWKTHRDNQLDRLDHGTHNRGERCGSSKLTEVDIREIRSLRDIATHQQLSVSYGVSPSLISLIQSGKRWEWLT